MTGTTATRDFFAHDPWRPVPVPTIVTAVPVDTSIAPPSLALVTAEVEPCPADAPIPGTVPAHDFDAWRPLQAVPGPAPVMPAPPRDLDREAIAAQFATVARSRGKLDRARAYAGRLGTHAAEIRTKLAAAAERQVAAAIGTIEPDPAEVGPLRGEAVEVDRQHRQALVILADVEAEHIRHEADLAALCGSDGAARAKLAEAHAARTLAQTAADAAKALLDRATAHAEAVNGKLTAARADEARHDADATARLRAALADGDTPPAVAEPFTRSSPGLEDDLRAARATVDTLTAEHTARVAILEKARLAVLAAVDGVMVVDAEAAARELQAADSRALALRVRLHTFVQRTASDYVQPQPGPLRKLPNGLFERDPGPLLSPARPMRSTPAIGHVIASGPLPPHQGPFSANWANEGAAWDAYAAALVTDPQAEPAFAEEVAVPSAPSIPAPRVA